MPGDSTSYESFSDVRDLLDRALESRHGLRVKMDSRRAAIYLRARCHSARKLDRDESKKIYEPGDAAYGKSPHDVLLLRVKDSVLEINKHPDGEIFGVVSIEEIEDEGHGDPSSSPADE